MFARDRVRACAKWSEVPSRRVKDIQYSLEIKASRASGTGSQSIEST